MKKSQLAGYLLEDIIAKLLEINGYEIINYNSINPNIESEDFVRSGNGLNILGRGGTHQFDTLGQFKWNLPLIFPIRLFIEAKHRQNRVGIDLVRSGIGILTDLNHAYNTVAVNNEKLSVQRYNYNYAIFSSSGFSEPAIRMAIAHKIHLVNLQDENFKIILSMIDMVINNILSFLDLSINEDIPIEVTRRILDTFRLSLRDSFDLPIPNSIEDILVTSLLELSREVRQQPPLYLGSPNTPFVLGIRAVDLTNNRNFIDCIKEDSEQDVTITWNNENSLWYIQSINGEYTLTFSLPNTLAQYIFEVEGEVYTRALNMKSSRLNRITLIINNEEIGKPIICNLNFNREETLRIINRYLE